MSSAHKISPTNPRIGSLLTDVEKGNIKIPVFQRQFVWEDDQIASFLDSIYRGYPVGSILLWSTKESLRHERNLGGFKLPSVPEDYPVQYVLDGQQRLTTLYGVFHSDAAIEDKELAIRFNISFDPNGELFIRTDKCGRKPVINLNKILDTTKLLPELGHFKPEQAKIIASLTERFKDYEFPVVTIKERTNQEVCRVFQRINSSGTKLSTLELLAAWTWSDNFDLNNEIKLLIETISDRGYEDLDEVLIMRSLASIVIDDIETDELVDVKADKLVAGMTKLKSSMIATIDFIESEIGIKNIVFIPFPIMIVPLVKFFSVNMNPTISQRRQILRWFWHCSFTQRYKAGTNTSVREDLMSMMQLANGKDTYKSLKAKIDPSIFRKTWRINSTAAKAAICLMAQLSPRSLISGRPIDLGVALAAYNTREFHHIYPKAFLLAQGVQFHESNIIANICMITSTDNKTISDNNPKVYFKKIKTDRNNIFEKAIISKEFWEGDKNYGEFVASRSNMFSKYAEQLIQKGKI